jgi:hypothetical protein
MEDALKNRPTAIRRDISNGRFVAGTCGRPAGSRNRRTAEKAASLKVDPFDYLADLLADPKTAPELRVQSASTLLPYCYAKLKEQPVRRVANPIMISPPKSASEAADIIAMITSRVAAGKMDISDGNDIIKMAESFARVYAAADFEALAQRVRAEVWADIQGGAARPVIEGGPPN